MRVAVAIEDITPDKCFSEHILQESLKIIEKHVKIECIVTPMVKAGFTWLMMSTKLKNPVEFLIVSNDITEEMGKLKEKQLDFMINFDGKNVYSKEFIDSFGLGIVGVHPSALPENRGSHHSFWGIMNETILGATLFWLDEGLDTGDIIDQYFFLGDNVSCAEEIIRKAYMLVPVLLDLNLPRIVNGTAARIPQQSEEPGHRKKEIKKATTLWVGDSISVKHLSKLIRATKAYGNGFYITDGETEHKIRSEIDSYPVHFIPPVF